MKIRSELISGAANTVSGCVKWIEQDGLSVIVFGLSNLVAISDASESKIIATLRGHTGKVTAIDYKANDDYICIYSGSEDSTIRIWQSQGVLKGNDLVDYKSEDSTTSLSQSSEKLTNWTCVSILKSWSSSIISVSVCSHKGNSLIFGADSAGRLSVWSFQSEDNKYTAEEIDSFVVPPTQLPRVIKVCSYTSPQSNTSDVLLFIGSVDSKIHVRVASTPNIEDALIEKMSKNEPSRSNKQIFKYCGSLAGHEEWITSIAVFVGRIDHTSSSKAVSITLASASQDCKVRIWRFNSIDISKEVLESNIRVVEKTDEEEEEEDLLDAKEDDVVLGQEEILSEARLEFSSYLNKWTVYLDALLIGHEDWVTFVEFITDSSNQCSRLFTTSMDRNMIIWSTDEHTGAWVPLSRMGDIGGTLGGSVGQNLLGFVGGTLSSDGKRLLGIGYGGSFHLWVNNIDGNGDRWQPQLYMTGHFSSVNDMSWQPQQGHYFITVSSDQTSRLYAPIKSGHWKEISRPQIHGYDLNCIAIESPPSYRFYSGSDEKVIRVFDAPMIVINGLEKLCSIPMNSSSSNRVPQAYIPELGLSNKASEFMTQQELREQESRGVVALDYSLPPLEGQLADHTIWPEVKKLFGHKNEVMCMDISADGLLMVSACKARDALSARISVWDTSKMVCIEQLAGHDSSIVRLKFSPDSRILASVGKDRSLVLHLRSNLLSMQQSQLFTTVQIKKSAHKRIIWDCCWIPLSALETDRGISQGVNTSYLVTVSRDGVCKVWKVTYTTTEMLEVVAIHNFSPFNGLAVTSIDIRKSVSTNNDYLAVVGAEDGSIQLWNIALSNQSGNDNCASSLAADIPSQYCHGAAVKRLAFQPSAINSSTIIFSSCGEDNTVRVISAAR